MRTVDEIQKEIDSLVLNIGTQNFFHLNKISLQIELLTVLLREQHEATASRMPAR